ncbi:hypothetical protein EA456_02520 [Streptococcus dysgalactiae subsp. dysgalactiae]|uniref:Uncharacterized protein n=1 Tax=Anaerococcus tetradius TaxID=33036 RepID=A0A133KEE9_9FIRM|nr:hypothetical protein SAG0355_09535 [Streptococcus agalactiae GB00909]EPV58576.1 hypothetical protein SAG0350_10555 [Streptococcus agalactiae GB00897]EPW65983.1 hypothetical protein SAG0095_09120 [Streptococcus agalactiae BSU248]KAF1125726.1 hypothetical protein B8V02_06615 [Streptococcus agalactiae]KGF31580.1 hypothetical protein HMPREF2134_12945 [Peptoniphilus lacrimalis DNF00528]KWZ77916.1 hypothetical protein HMPREF3200_01063 [Anaerococcus tetradius]KXA00102.1 hypothetical protein HMPRE
MLKDKIEKYTFVMGVIVFIVSYNLPINMLNRFTELKPLGLSTFFICPILGIIGLIFSFKRKSILFSILNLILILSFSITMFLGNLFFE